MHLKVYMNFIHVLYALSLIHASNQTEWDFGRPEWECAASRAEYYMNIKTGNDLQWMNRKDNPQWAIKDHFDDEFLANCKVKLDDKDNFYLYLLKNQTTPTLHGPVKLDSKHIELDVKVNMSEKIKDECSKNMENFVKYMSLDDVKLEVMSYVRCILASLVYKMQYFKLPEIPLNIYLELDTKTAALFPKIEKNDYFIMNIINFADTIKPRIERTGDYHPETTDSSIANEYGLEVWINWIAASHSILNYTIISPDIFNEI